ncbi:MAG: anthranilate synthase component I [Deltaproteobacteria bacterium]|nr:anthranilate synthase component I [Deltaproteobacteria bacterium]
MRVEIDADTETPVSAFLKVGAREPHAFLFESVEGGERAARFSFLGARPRDIFSWKLEDGGNPLEYIQKNLAQHKSIPLANVPSFAGGLVGYISYDIVKLFEPRVPITNPNELGFPDVLMMDFDTIIAFDNLRHSMQIIAEVRCNKGDDPEALYADAQDRIRTVLAQLARPLRDRRERQIRPSNLKPCIDQAKYEAMVRRAREYIKAGDCQQIVVAQRFEAEVDLSPFDIYRSLRRVNPSPYLFFMQDGKRALIGSSPETLVKLEGGEVTVRPIAGTRPRGRDVAEDLRLEQELRADPKENAEHVMLVDLGRNDVGRVAKVGTVKVTALKKVERYSHVMHLVSEVRGQLAEDLDALDVLRAAFPAGTVTGAPKVRAMQIIDELETSRRGPYAGAVGYFDHGGNMEMCIAIRTLLQSSKKLSVEAGAGIVFDSKPAKEFQETVNKAKGPFTAVAAAEVRALDGVALAPIASKNKATSKRNK